eukprot:13604112-Ditylum_brightwellii.AAC.1
MGSNNDVNSTSRMTWNKKIKEHLQGKQLTDRNIQDFFCKKNGPKRSFDKNRIGHTKKRMLYGIFEVKKRSSTTFMETTTVMHA